MATIIPAHTGVASWSHPTGAEGRFRPNGKLELITSADMRPNVSTWRSAGNQTMAARLFVGFNVGGKPRWTMEDLIRVVRGARVAQHQRQDASFVAQKGIYTHTAPGRSPKIIEEKGAQVILIRMPDEPEGAFRGHMVELAEAIADRLKQAEVVLELQRGGIVQEVMGVAP
jgi:hypothetical protein